MTVHLVFPPHWLPTAPYLALPTLVSALTQAGIRAVQHDLALDAFEWLLEQPLGDPNAPGVIDLALHALDRAGSMRSDGWRSTFRSRSFLQPETARSAQVALDWWFFRLQAAWPNLTIDRYRYRARSGSYAGLDDSSMYIDGEVPDHPYRPFLRSWVQSLPIKDGDVVGISLTTANQLLGAADVGREVRVCHRNARVVIGGAWLSRIREEGVRRVADIVGAHAAVVGEGTEEIVRCLGDREWGPGRPLRHVRVARPGRFFPIPTFERRRLEHYLLPRPVLPVWNAKGCYYGRCSFCDEPSTFDGASRGSNPEQLAGQIALLSAQHPDAVFQLNAECDSPKRLRRFADALVAQRTNVVWSARARLESGFADPALLDALAASGCRLLVFGLESTEDSVLRDMGKGFTSSEAREVLDAVGASGIWRSVFMILGYPGADPEETVAACRDIQEREPRLADSVQCSVLRVPPLAPLASRAVATRPDFDDLRGLADRVVQHDPWAFSGGTREGLLVALASLPNDVVRTGLDGFMR